MSRRKKRTNKLLEYLWKYKHMYVIGVIILLIVDHFDLYIPQYIGEVTDGLSAHTIDAAGVYSILIKMIIVAGVIALGRFSYRYFIIGTSRKIERQLQNDIFAKMETLSQRFFNENKTGDLMAYFTNDIESIREAIGWSVISAVDAIVLTTMCLYRMMTTVSVTLTLMTLIPMVGIGFYGYFIMNAFERNFTARHESFAHLSDEAQESISAERVIKAFVQEDRQQKHFEQVNDHNRQVNLKLARLRSYAWPGMEVFIGIAYVIAIAFGGYFCLIGDITLGRFVAFASYVNILVWPMLAFGDTIITFTQGIAGMKRINKVFWTKPEIVDCAHPAKVEKVEGEISFEDVSFRYLENLPYALQDINVHIEKGETFAIMGRTGAGKTTMVNLIARLYDVTSGTIRVDGIDIRKMPLKVLRESIAYVPQDNFLFSETLGQNISFGKLDATLDEIIEACKMADIDSNIQDFPEKYDTMVGERGVTLSGGQKQRASIARAILKDSPILILDDSLSAVDTDTEDTILANLRKIRQGKTTIMIAHRVSTVQAADHIIFLEDGKIAEMGTYQELVDLDGQFAAMVRKQQLEKQLAEDE